MATNTREIEEKLASGEVPVIRVGGTGSDNEVALVGTTENLDTRVTALENPAPGSGDPNKLENTVAQFVPQDPSSVTPGAGKVFFDSITQSLSVRNDIVGTTLNLGYESVIRVVNNTGSTILNGQACRQAGAANGVPQITLALADTFHNAIVLGVATEDILDGAEGLITTQGLISDINTAGETLGALLYLSDTIPGGLVENVPRIISRVAGVLVADATAGSICVGITNNMVLPTVLGALSHAPLPNTINVVAQDITNYTQEAFHIATVEMLTGAIYLPYAGVYRVSATVNITFDDTANNTGNAILSLHDGSVTILDVWFNVPKNSTGLNMTLSVPTGLPAQSSYTLRVASTVDLTNVQDNAVSFDIKSEVLDL